MYWDYLATICLSFNQCQFVHLPREENQIADALATLASMWKSAIRSDVKPLILARSRSPYYEEVRVMLVQTVEKPWFHDLQRYLEMGQFPEDAKMKERMSLRMLSRQFISYQGMLYKRMPTGVHLRCVDKDKTQKLIEAIHKGVYGAHMNGMILAKKIARQEYF